MKALAVTRLSDLDDDATSLPSVTAARRQADKLVGDGSRSSVIMAPLLWLAKKASALPLSVMTDDDAEVDRPEMLDLLTWPLRFEIAIDVPLYGNAYMEILRGGMGQPERLRYLPVAWVAPQAAPEDPDVLAPSR